MTEVMSGICPTCGAPQPAAFCSTCGEKRITAHDYSIAHFAEHLVEILTHFDIRSLRAVKILALQPGELTRAYLDGRRKPFIGPIQLFVILNVVFALLGGVTFRAALEMKNSGWFAPQMQAAAAKTQARMQMDDAEFENEFARTATTQSKTWIFLMIPMFAAELALLYGLRRYFFEHLIFSTHIHAFLLAWSLLGGISLALTLRVAGASAQTRNIVISAVLLVGLLVYLYAALRRTYGDGRLGAVLRSFALAVLWLLTVNVYRLLLFFITLRLMH